MNFEINKQFVLDIKEAIERQDESMAVDLMHDLHPADIAMLYDDLNIDEAKFLFLLLDGEIAADVIAELDDDDRERFLSVLPTDVIAKVFIDNMETDDAADVLGEMSEDRKDEVLAFMEDIEHAGDIVDLLDYEEDTAGGLMQKEYIAVYSNTDVKSCIEEIRKQAEEVDEIFYVYVIGNEEVLEGVLSLKKLILSSPNTKVEKIMDDDPILVKTSTEAEEVVNLMDKYDLISLPVVDPIGRLVGRITIDDVVDVLREEAEKDYQMATGLSEDVELSDSVWRLTRARIPWLLFGLAGGIISSRIIGIFENDMTKLATTAIFLPLIAATAGNVGIQSSSIIVQAIANDTFDKQGFWNKIFKELRVSLLNAGALSAIIFLYSVFFLNSNVITIGVSLSIFIVVVFASVFGVIVPITLNKFKIDPAIATGPFITIVNDIAGMSIYLTIIRMLYTALM
ncbi:MAG: magnesium transporter [Bacteroidales bacterium]|nr:magnesium transporter [Bacteroidales bacterium]